MTENRDDQDQWRRDYDQRQYRRMVERIDAFLADHLGIDQLNADLGTLLNALEGNIEKRWENDFTTLRNELALTAPDPDDRREEEMRQAREMAAQIRRVVLPKITSDQADDSLQG